MPGDAGFVPKAPPVVLCMPNPPPCELPPRAKTSVGAAVDKNADSRRRLITVVFMTNSSAILLCWRQPREDVLVPDRFSRVSGSSKSDG